MRSFKTLIVVSALALLTLPLPAFAQPLFEDFTDVPGLRDKGWVFQNNSDPTPESLPDAEWTQGNISIFPAHGSDDDSYAAASFESVGEADPPGGTISNWLITPTVTVSNGDLISFYTRTVDALAFPDRLEVRLSLNGINADVGNTAISVGDFTTNLLTINPDLQIGEENYPITFTRFVITLTGLPEGPTEVRIGFRYFVTDAGINGTNSNYIGIDTLAIGAAIDAPEPSSLGLLGGCGLLSLIGRRVYRRRKKGQAGL